jgi:hypothetical protein
VLPTARALRTHKDRTETPLPKAKYTGQTLRRGIVVPGELTVTSEFTLPAVFGSFKILETHRRKSTVSGKPPRVKIRAKSGFHFS